MPTQKVNYLNSKEVYYRLLLKTKVLIKLISLFTPKLYILN
jgi:hypothetical protein